MRVSGLNRLGVLASFGFLLAGCTHTAALTYTPAAGPVGGPTNRAIALRVLDQRENTEPTRIGFVRRGVMSGPLHETREVARVMLDALRTGLESDGHRIVAETARPDVFVTARLVQLTSREAGFSVQSLIVGDIVVRRTDDGAPALERRLQYEVTERMMVRLVSVYETALNKAIEQFVDRVRGLVREAIGLSFDASRRLARWLPVHPPRLPPSVSCGQGFAVVAAGRVRNGEPFRELTPDLRGGEESWC